MSAPALSRATPSQLDGACNWSAGTACAALLAHGRSQRRPLPQHRAWVRRIRGERRSLSTLKRPSTQESLEAVYLDYVKLHGLQRDLEQLRAVQVLQKVRDDLVAYSQMSVAQQGAARQPPKGAYLWSTLPGTGKTMLMELFYNNVPLSNKKRVHFSAFMLEIHDRLHNFRKRVHNWDNEPRTKHQSNYGLFRIVLRALLGRPEEAARAEQHDLSTNPIDIVAGDMANVCQLLCLDEMQVTDIADAMVLRRFYDVFRSRGGTLVATSNRAPANLYENGLQRDLFIPFIDAVQRDCHVVKLDSRVDYRLQALLEESADTSQLPLFIYPQTPANRERFEQLLDKLAKRSEGSVRGSVSPVRYETVVVRTLGRALRVERAFPRASIARFHFDELCDRPLAAVDYIALAERFQTFFLENIPSQIEDRNIARRFITLVDILYDRRARLICLAGGSPEQIFHLPDEKSDEAFAAQRCISRLLDMQTKTYIKATSDPTEHLRESEKPRVATIEATSFLIY